MRLHTHHATAGKLDLAGEATGLGVEISERSDQPWTNKPSAGLDVAFKHSGQRIYSSSVCVCVAEDVGQDV